jgi:hypothetical protein
MQPVGVIVKPIEVGEWRRAGGLVVTQAGAIGVKVPLQGPRPHAEAGTGVLAVTIAPGIQDPIEMAVRTIDSVGRTVRPADSHQQG